MIRGIDSSTSEPVNKGGLRTAEAAERAGGRDGDADDAGSASRASDKVSLGTREAGATYRKPTAQELTFDARLSAMRDLVARTFEKQGLSMTIDVGDGRSVDLASLSPGEAKGLVADDGYWGVEKTAKRIFDFASQAAGNDPSKLEFVKAAIQKGYSMAEKGFGGSLPEISGKTLSKVMSMLDEWAKAGSPSAPASGDGTQAPPA